MQRSFGLITVALTQLTISLVSCASGVLLVLLFMGRIELFSADLSQLSTYFRGLILAGLLISVLGVAASVGLLLCRRWGWFASIVFQVLCVVNNGLAIAGGQAPSVGVYVSALLCVLLTGVLFLPNVRPDDYGSPV